MWSGNWVVKGMICEDFKTLSLWLLSFFRWQKRPPSHHGVWNRVGCHLCFVWEVLQSILSDTRLRWGLDRKALIAAFFFFSVIHFLWFISVFVYVSESAPKVQPRIPSASLSQSMAVEETVLPAASQNITAYAVNTERTQGYWHTLANTHLV